MTTEMTPRYCGRCGDRLEVARSDLGYDTRTGSPKFAYWLTCPKAPHKDSPYQPYGIGSVKYTNHDGSKFDDKEVAKYQFYRDCTPWPELVAEVVV